MGAFAPLSVFAQVINDSDTGGGVSADTLRSTTAQTVSASEIQLQARENARDASLNQTLGTGATNDPGLGIAPGSGSVTAAANNAKKDSDLANKDFCTISWAGFPSRPLDCVGYLMMRLGGWTLTVAGVFLNLSIDFTILQMSDFVKNTGAINAAWKVFRDLANIFFIFILIYIAISTIIGTASGQTQKMLINVIVVALIINFSMFFTKVIIDTSNIFTIQFYNSISKGDNSLDNGLSWVFMNASKLTSIYTVADGTLTANPQNTFTSYNMFTVGIMSLIFCIILAFVFLAIALMLVIRFAILIFLMILSPLALMGFAHPKLKGKFDSWWHALIDQALFAPVAMMMLWVVALIVNSPGFHTALHSDFASTSFVGLVQASIKDSIYVILNFVILIALLIGGFVIAKGTSKTGSSFAMKYAGRASFGAAGWLGRRTIGRGANAIANSSTLKKFVADRPVLGNYALKAAKGVASTNFDLRGIAQIGDRVGGPEQKGGYKADLDKQVKDHQEVAALLKDVKIYKGDAGKEAAQHKETTQREDARVISTDKEITALRASGATVTNDGKTLQDLEKQKAKAIKARDDAKKKLDELNKDQSRTTTGEQAYGQNLIATSILGKVVAKLSNPVTGIESGRQKASEEIGEKFEKERIKSDTEWAKKYQMNEIDKKLAQLDQDLKNIGTASLETAEDIEKWDEQLKKNRKELEEWGQKQKTDPNFDVVAFNKRSKILEADNANLDKQISLAKKGGEDARNAKKMSFEAEKLKLENEKKGLKDKKDRDELIKGLGELVKKEGDSGHAAPTAAAAVPSPVPTAPSGGGGH